MNPTKSVMDLDEAVPSGADRTSRRSAPVAPGGRRVVSPVALDWASGEHPAYLSKRSDGAATAVEDEVIKNRESDTSELAEVPIGSLEAAVGYGSLLRQMHRSYLRRVAFYRTPAGGAMSSKDAREAAFHAPVDDEEARRQFERLWRLPLDSIDFADLMELQAADPEVAEWFWERAKREGRAEFESGHGAANTTLPLDGDKELWNVARYMGVRESFAAEWRPRGGIEIALVDMLAQSWTELQYWTKESSLRAKTEPRRPDREYS